MPESQKPRKKRSDIKARIIRIGDSQPQIQDTDPWFPIDWSKVKTTNDIKIILSNMGLGCRASAPNYESLKKYLSDTPQIPQ